MRSFRQVLSLSLGSLLVACTFAACDGGSSNPHADDNRKVSSLSAADQTKLCQDERAAVTDDQKAALGKISCILGLSFSGDGQCTPAAVDACVADFVKQSEPGAECSLDLDVAHCDVTVSQLVACSDDQLDAITEAADKATCDNLLTPGTLPQNPPESCNVVKEKCPSAFSDDSSSKMKLQF